MKISDLSKALDRAMAEYGDLEIIERRCSDYSLMDETDWSVVEALPPGEGRVYFMRSHASMKPEWRQQLQKYLRFEGN